MITAFFKVISTITGLSHRSDPVHSPGGVPSILGRGPEKTLFSDQDSQI